jgi:chaperone BCS1
MLLLEDVDILQAATTRQEEQGRTSLSGLLNALDGVSTPHGLITVLTTNDMTKLDPALIRPGRVDRIEEIGHLDDDGLADLFTLVFGATNDRPTLAGMAITPAEVMEIFKRNLDAPAIATAEFELLVDEKAKLRGS